MLPIFAEEKCAFEFSQELEVATRETAQTPPVKSRAAQQGFLCIESQLQGTPPARISRFVTQHLLSPQAMARLRTLRQAPRKELAEEHLRIYFSLSKPFGLELPFEFLTDLANGGATPAADPGRPGKPKPAIPYDIVHWPLVTPGLSAEDPAVGKGWKSAIVVRCGFGNYTLPYSAHWIARDLASVTAEMTFDPPAAGAASSEKPVVLDGVHLKFRAAGVWTVTYALVDGGPAVGKGALQYSVVADVPAEGTTTEVINVKLGFQWKRVPVGFTPQALMTETWAKLS